MAGLQTIGCSIFVILTLCASAHANPEIDRRRADELFAAGRRLLLEERDAAGACKKFEAAIQVDPGAVGTLLNLGLCYQALTRYGTSLAWFRKALVRATESNDPEMTAYADAARTAIVELVALVPTLRISVPNGHVDLTLDGVPISPTSFGELEVDVGRHLIVARGPGKVTKTIVAVAGLGDKLVPITIELADAVPIAEAIVIDRRRPRIRAAWILGGSSAALFAFSAAYGFYLRAEQIDALDDRDAAIRSGDTMAADAASARHELAGDHLAVRDTALFSVATLLLGAAILAYVTAPSAPRRIAPMVGKDGAGVAVGGVF